MAGIAGDSIAGASIAGTSIAAVGNQTVGAAYNFADNTTTSFTPPRAGYWAFAAYGAGYTTGASGDAGDSGSFGFVTAYLTPASVVTVALNKTVTITLPNGRVCVAGAASAAGGAGPGVATGFDVNMGGTNGATGANPGGTAPSYGNFKGGAGGNASDGKWPGGGGSTGSSPGGGPMALAYFVKS